MYRDEQHRRERGAVTCCPKHLIEDRECVCVGGGGKGCMLQGSI